MPATRHVCLHSWFVRLCVRASGDTEQQQHQTLQECKHSQDENTCFLFASVILSQSKSRHLISKGTKMSSSLNSKLKYNKRFLPVTLLRWNNVFYAQSDPLVVSSAEQNAKVIVPTCRMNSTLPSVFCHYFMNSSLSPSTLNAGFSLSFFLNY